MHCSSSSSTTCTCSSPWWVSQGPSPVVCPLGGSPATHAGLLALVDMFAVHQTCVSVANRALHGPSATRFCGRVHLGAISGSTLAREICFELTWSLTQSLGGHPAGRRQELLSSGCSVQTVPEMAVSRRSAITSILTVIRWAPT